MKHARIADLPWQEQRSPSGKFCSYFRNISLALGASRNVGTWGGGHPFDLQIRRLPPGSSVCPFHLHLVQWEMFVVLAGTATVRSGPESSPVRTGDIFFHPPGLPHQLTNTGEIDLEVLIIADNPVIDGCYYPDSNKWAIRPPGKVFRMTEVDYFDGEDASPATASSYRPPPSPEQPPIAPFAERKCHVDEIAWETWESPKKQFRGTSKELSIALGAKRNTPIGLGGHPFDLEFSKLSPGEVGCPFHSHSAQWELYYIVSGTATVRAGDASHTFGSGEICIHPPEEPHQIRNASATEDLVFYLVADNPPVDYCYYPDSNKWGLRSPRMFFRPETVEYYDGEE